MRCVNLQGTVNGKIDYTFIINPETGTVSLLHINNYKL